MLIYFINVWKNQDLYENFTSTQAYVSRTKTKQLRLLVLYWLWIKIHINSCYIWRSNTVERNSSSYLLSNTLLIKVQLRPYIIVAFKIFNLNNKYYLFKKHIRLHDIRICLLSLPCLYSTLFLPVCSLLTTTVITKASVLDHDEKTWWTI